MVLLFDDISCRYFKSDIHELIIKERELNNLFMYGRMSGKTQITYNDLMCELFDAPIMRNGDYINFNMPIQLEIFKQTINDNEQIYMMKIIEH